MSLHNNLEICAHMHAAGREPFAGDIYNLQSFNWVCEDPVQKCWDQCVCNGIVDMR